MARTREFEIDDVLRKAMEVFWKRGYAATSMADIYEATGLKPGSLYAAFKDKEELFRRCFETYADHFRATLPQDRTGLAAIEAWLALQARLAADDPDRKGCLIINTVTERDIHSAATRALANGRLQEIPAILREAPILGRSRGEVRKGTKIDVQADALLGAVVGIMALGRAGADKRLIENLAEAAYAPLPK